MHIYTHDTCLEHTVAQGHPERPERLSHLLAHLQNCGISREYPTRLAPTATPADVLRAHPQTHLGFLESMRPDSGVVPVDPDTWMSPASLNAALTAAGAVCAGVDDVLSGSTQRVFCAVRPPGHHAESDSAMGFCLLNSVAIGALKALTSPDINRVAIFDFDVHHGNGTVEIFRDNPSVLVCSSFQHPYYPNRYDNLKQPNIVNTPLAAGTESQDFRKAVEDSWTTAVAQHQPDIILVSAGFDAHFLDPLAQLNLEEEDFAWVTRLITDFAADTPTRGIISTLEGGYDLNALSHSVEVHLRALSLS